jgi:hypothetical protein
MAMSARTDALARKVEKVNDDLRAVIEQSTPAQWSAKCADGDWTQGFSGFHAANSVGFITGMIQGLANGVGLPPMTMADIDQQNAGQLAEHSGCTKEQALELLKAGSPASVQMVRGLSDEQLDRKVSLLTGMPEMSVEQVIEMLMIGHAAGHTASIKNAR